MTYNLTQFSYYLPGDSIRCHSLRVLSRKTPSPLTLDDNSKSRLLLVLLTDQLEIRGFYTPSLGSVHFLEQLAELRETAYLMVTSLLKKNVVRDAGEHPDGEDTHGKVCGKGCGAFMPSPSTSTRSPTWKLSESHTVGIFMEPSSRRRDQLLTPFPAPFPSLENGD